MEVIRIGAVAEDRVESLKVKHARLDAEIQNENNRPHPDFVHITELKREKLKIKDEINRMSG